MPESAKRYTGSKKAPVNRVCHTHDNTRGNAGERGYNRRWQRARLVYLDNHPLCDECARHGHVTEATVVDHITPHKGDPVLFWDVENWQSLCRLCHDRKTGKGQ